MIHRLNNPQQLLCYSCICIMNGTGWKTKGWEAPSCSALPEEQDKGLLSIRSYSLLCVCRGEQRAEGDENLDILFLLLWIQRQKAMCWEALCGTWSITQVPYSWLYSLKWRCYPHVMEVFWPHGPLAEQIFPSRHHKQLHLAACGVLLSVRRVVRVEEKGGPNLLWLFQGSQQGQPYVSQKQWRADGQTSYDQALNSCRLHCCFMEAPHAASHPFVPIPCLLFYVSM